MATATDHLANADHNRAMLDATDPVAFPDWTATTAFYAAVHLVEAVFRHDGHPPSKNHAARGELLRRAYRDLWQGYRPLQDLAQIARYECRPVRQIEVVAALPRLNAIETFVRARVEGV